MAVACGGELVAAGLLLTMHRYLSREEDYH
jgi:hypothetical protein